MAWKFGGSGFKLFSSTCFTAIPGCFHTVCGCLPATRAGVRSCVRNHTTCKTQNIYYLALYRKSLLPLSRASVTQWLHCCFPHPREFPSVTLGKIAFAASPLFPDAWDYLVPTISGQLTVRVKLIPQSPASQIDLNVFGEISIFFKIYMKQEA